MIYDTDPYESLSEEECARGNHAYDRPYRGGHSLAERLTFHTCLVCGQVDPVMHPCYLCDEFRPPLRQEVKSYTSPGPDPTQVYVLDCGHKII